MHNNGYIARIIIGTFLILFGLSIFFDQIGLNLYGFSMFDFWPIILIVLGVWLFSTRHFFGGTALLIFGSAFLAANIFNFSIFAVFWPVLIICVGLSVLFKPQNHWKHQQGSAGRTTKNRLNESIVFWAIDELVNSENFEGGKVDAVFGGFKLDLRDAKISKDGALLEINTVFGGGELILPRNVRIDTETSAFMGGVTNRALSSSDKNDPLLRIKAAAVFGGIEIKN